MLASAPAIANSQQRRNIHLTAPRNLNLGSLEKNISDGGVGIDVHRWNRLTRGNNNSQMWRDRAFKVNMNKMVKICTLIYVTHHLLGAIHSCRQHLTAVACKDLHHATKP